MSLTITWRRYKYVLWPNILLYFTLEMSSMCLLKYEIFYNSFRKCPLTVRTLFWLWDLKIILIMIRLPHCFQQSKMKKESCSLEMKIYNPFVGLFELLYQLNLQKFSFIIQNEILLRYLCCIFQDTNTDWQNVC